MSAPKKFTNRPPPEIQAIVNVGPISTPIYGPYLPGFVIGSLAPSIRAYSHDFSGANSNSI